MKTIGFIGGGRITRIILQGWTNNGRNLTGIKVFDPNATVLFGLLSQFPDISVSKDSIAEAAGCDYLFLAVHPPVMAETLLAIHGNIGNSTVIISLVPKFTIERIGAAIGNNVSIIRMNPSASSFINEGLNPVCYPSEIDLSLRSEVEGLLSPLGRMPEVEESKIEAYAMINAMGPTYFWFQIQKLKELAVQFGLQDDEAREVISKMMEGATNTLFKSGLTYDGVVDLVPVKPIGSAEDTIKGFYDEFLPGLYAKIRP